MLILHSFFPMTFPFPFLEALVLLLGLAETGNNTTSYVYGCPLILSFANATYRLLIHMQYPYNVKVEKDAGQLSRWSLFKLLPRTWVQMFTQVEHHLPAWQKTSLWKLPLLPMVAALTSPSTVYYNLVKLVIVHHWVVLSFNFEFCIVCKLTNLLRILLLYILLCSYPVCFCSCILWVVRLAQMNSQHH